MDIDFVITWVDMDDPKWQAEFAKYSGKKENTLAHSPVPGVAVATANELMGIFS